MRCREEFDYHKRAIRFLRELSRTVERLCTFCLCDETLDQPYDQWYSLTSFAVFGDDCYHEARVRAQNKLFLTWEQRIIFYAIPPQTRRDLFLPIEGAYDEGGFFSPPISLCVSTPPVFAYLSRLYFLGGELDRHNLATMAMSEFAIIALFAFLYFALNGRAISGRETDPRIDSYADLPEGRLWRLPESLCEVIDELGFFSIVECRGELDPILAYRSYCSTRAIDWGGRPMDASYFPYECNFGRVLSLPGAALSVARYRDSDTGELVVFGHDERSLPAVYPVFHTRAVRSDKAYFVWVRGRF